MQFMALFTRHPDKADTPASADCGKRSLKRCADSTQTA